MTLTVTYTCFTAYAKSPITAMKLNLVLFWYKVTVNREEDVIAISLAGVVSQCCANWCDICFSSAICTVTN